MAKRSSIAASLRGLVLVGVVLALSAAAPQSAAPLSSAERSAIVEALARDDAPPALTVNASDQTLLAAAAEYARKMLGQRIEPSSVERMWTIEPPRANLGDAFAAARAGNSLPAWLAGLEPDLPEYQALKAARAKYVAIVTAGGWRDLPAGKAIKKGDQGEAVLALRARLLAEGYAMTATETPQLFDADLEAALGRFQQLQGLESDGVVGSGTRQALNITAAERLSQIDANLERLRWLPRPLPADRMVVDTGRAESALYLAGRPALSMRMVVGKPSTKSPMFASTLQAVVFNPPWNVPASIAANEVLPRARRQPGYFASQGFIIKPDGGVQQKPGPKNALGRLKIELPSPFGVYLHDTPSRAAFSQTGRHLSHGCMRLEKPRELAQLLLNWSREDVDAEVNSGATRRHALPRQIPLLVVHTTAFAEAGGAVAFRPDVYGWDAKLTRALANRPVQQAAAAPLVSECSG